MAGEGGDELHVMCNDYLCYFEWKIFSKADEVIKVSKLWGEDRGWKKRTGVEKHIICDNTTTSHAKFGNLIDIKDFTNCVIYNCPGAFFM